MVQVPNAILGAGETNSLKAKDARPKPPQSLEPFVSHQSKEEEAAFTDVPEADSYHKQWQRLGGALRLYTF